MSGRAALPPRRALRRGSSSALRPPFAPTWMSSKDHFPNSLASGMAAMVTGRVRRWPATQGKRASRVPADRVLSGARAGASLQGGCDLGCCAPGRHARMHQNVKGPFNDCYMRGTAGGRRCCSPRFASTLTIAHARRRCVPVTNNMLYTHTRHASSSRTKGCSKAQHPRPQSPTDRAS